MTPVPGGLWKIWVLGDVVVQHDGAEPIRFSDRRTDVLVSLALADGPLSPAQLRDRREISGTQHRPAQNAFVQHVSALRDPGIPIETRGPHRAESYLLNADHVWVDAWQFLRPPATDLSLEDSLRLWRGPVRRPGLTATVFERIEQARLDLVSRVLGVAQPDTALRDAVIGFIAAFPGDSLADQLRARYGRERKRILVVDDDPDVRREICGQLEPNHDVEPIKDIEAWRNLRDRPQDLARIDGALVDLHLKGGDDDNRGMEIVKYLRRHTEVPVAVVTANIRQGTTRQVTDLMAEYRIIDVVNKRQPDWLEALDDVLEQLIGTSDRAVRTRARSWLQTAYRDVRRDTEQAPPGSPGASRRRDCDREYQNLLPAVEARPVDELTDRVRTFCRRWRVD
ncbi:response regulator [Catenuloplanes japonicus]|uniref:response regulator n=1 Tax=Catenuloplanes japonicus TaxID=33876 RepID=UPI0012F9F6B1|nr:response regulator [Catenuloplanes japonicus]